MNVRRKAHVAVRNWNDTKMKYYNLLGVGIKTVYRKKQRAEKTLKFA